MNDGLMDDDAFDRMVTDSQQEAEELDPHLPTPSWMFDNGPSWRELHTAPSRLVLRMPTPTADYVGVHLDSSEARIVVDGVERAAASCASRKGDRVSFVRRPAFHGEMFELTTQGDDDAEPKMVLRWLAPPAAAAPAPVRKRWWRRWLDRAWPARAVG